MKLKLLLLLLCCETGFTQNAAADRSLRVVRVHGDAVAFCGLMKGTAGVDCQGDSALRAVVIKRASGGTAADVENAARTIEELDGLRGSSGSSNVELTTVVIAGSMQRVPGAQEATGEDLAPVVKQLRSIFPYTSYEILGTTLLRTNQEFAPHSTTGSLKWYGRNQDDNRSAPGYELQFGRVAVSEDRSISLGDIQFTTFVPPKAMIAGQLNSTTTHVSSQRVYIRSSVDLRENQKVVVGSATVADADTCLFLVISGKLVQ